MNTVSAILAFLGVTAVVVALTAMLRSRRAIAGQRSRLQAREAELESVLVDVRLIVSDTSWTAPALADLVLRQVASAQAVLERHDRANRERMAQIESASKPRAP